VTRSTLVTAAPAMFATPQLAALEALADKRPVYRMTQLIGAHTPD
jgi:hypothetical protein